jgi:hypothetical protein
MDSNFRRISRHWVAGVTLLGLGSVTACLSDKGEEAETGGAGSGTGGSTGGAGTGGGAGAGGKACIKISASKPAIADFDGYDGSADIATWSFPLGGDSTSGVVGGGFGYGDRASGTPETFAMVEGHASTYALGIADTNAIEYGGGMGLWLSDCLDASAFNGVSFWVKGDAPTGSAKLSLLTPETTSVEIMNGKGTCAGSQMECLPPNSMFPVTDAWTEIKVAWADLMPGSNLGEPVIADGKRLSQIQFDVALMWTPDDNGEYHPTPAPYGLTVDSLNFY